MTDIGPVDTVLNLAKERRHLPGPPADYLIYGAGNRGKEIRGALERHGYGVVAFVDQCGGPAVEVDGLRCYSPSDREPLRLNASGSPLLIAIWRHDIDLGAVAETLRQAGYQRIFTVYDFYESFPAEFSAPFWLSTTDQLLEHSEAIQRAFDLLSDEKSRATFLECLRLRATGDLDMLRNPDRTGQYFPADVWKIPRHLRMIDCGAFTGDTYRAISHSGADFDSYVALEPDPQNFQTLSASFRNAEVGHAVTLLPCGAWSDSQVLRFSGGSGDGSHIEAGGTQVIQAVGLDQALPTFDPNFIKMDIEGAEPEAIRGAERLIRRNRPYMAIASYHRPDHLWSLLLQINSMHLGYRFRIRYHWYTGFEVDLYAVPEA